MCLRSSLENMPYYCIAFTLELINGFIFRFPILNVDWNLIVCPYQSLLKIISDKFTETVIRCGIYLIKHSSDENTFIWWKYIHLVMHSSDETNNHLIKHSFDEAFIWSSIHLVHNWFAVTSIWWTIQLVIIRYLFKPSVICSNDFIICSNNLIIDFFHLQVCLCQYALQQLGPAAPRRWSRTCWPGLRSSSSWRWTRGLPRSRPLSEQKWLKLKVTVLSQFVCVF